MSSKYEPRILVKHKGMEKYALWLYEKQDWLPGAYYADNYDIIEWALTPDERKALNEFVDFHNQLVKEKQDANN